jgi:hypothetical protein
MITPEDKNTIRQLFDDADFYNYKALGAHAGIYDTIADYVAEHIFEDMSITQIQKTIWDAFYQHICIGTQDDEDKTIVAVLTKPQALPILGDHEKFVGMAKNIRWMVFGL